VALPPEIANFDYKSVFNPTDVHTVVLMVVATVMSAIVIGLYKAFSPYALGFLRGLFAFLALAVFLFLGIVALRISAPMPAPTIVLPPMGMAAWPAPLTKDELNDWGKALGAFKPLGVVITLLNDQQRPFVVSLHAAFRRANWPEPSIQPGNFVVGVRVLAGKNAVDAGRAVQDLCAKKLGMPVDFQQASGVTPDEVEVLVGWQPE
jgi:hypothetical protein